MVRKKLKQAIQLQQNVAEVQKSYQHNHDSDSTHHDSDILDVVNCWLQHLCLSLPETTSPQLDVFGALRNSGGNPFARVRGLQSLRARVQNATKANQQPPDTSGGTGTQIHHLDAGFVEDAAVSQ